MTKDYASVNHGLMHKINRALILRSLRRQPSQTRARLSKRTGLTRSTISNLTDELINKNFIYEVGYEPSTGGRRGILLELNPDGGSAIAVKINAFGVQCALSNFVGEILWHKLIPLTSTHPDTVLNIAQSLIQEAIHLNNNRMPIQGIGVGVTGLVSDDGEVIYSKFLEWEHVEFRADWEVEFGFPVSVYNDVSLAAFGEHHYGNATSHSHFIYIEVGYGLGAGIVINGQLYHGRNGYAGEAGNIMHSFPGKSNGIETVSWESMTNIPNLKRTVRRYIDEGKTTSIKKSNVKFNTIIQAAHQGDEVAVNALVELSRYLGIGLASLFNIFDIPIFLIGGELGKEYGPYLDYIQDEIQRYMIHTPPGGIQVRISSLMPDATLMGAVAQVFDEIIKEPALSVHL